MSLTVKGQISLPSIQLISRSTSTPNFMFCTMGEVKNFKGLLIFYMTENHMWQKMTVHSEAPKHQTITVIRKTHHAAQESASLPEQTGSLCGVRAQIQSPVLQQADVRNGKPSSFKQLHIQYIFTLTHL